MAAMNWSGRTHLTSMHGHAMMGDMTNPATWYEQRQSSTSQYTSHLRQNQFVTPSMVHPYHHYQSKSWGYQDTQNQHVYHTTYTAPASYTYPTRPANIGNGFNNPYFEAPPTDNRETGLLDWDALDRECETQHTLDKEYDLMQNRIISKSGLRYLPLNGSLLDSDGDECSPVSPGPGSPQVPVWSFHNSTHVYPVRSQTSSVSTAPQYLHQEQIENQVYDESFTVSPNLPTYDSHQQTMSLRKWVVHRLLVLYSHMVGATLNESRNPLDFRTICININSAGLGINKVVDLRYIQTTLQLNSAFTYNRMLTGWQFASNSDRKHFPTSLRLMIRAQVLLNIGNQNEAQVYWRMITDVNINENKHHVIDILKEIDSLKGKLSELPINRWRHLNKKVMDSPPERCKRSGRRAANQDSPVEIPSHAQLASVGVSTQPSLGGNGQMNLDSRREQNVETTIPMVPAQGLRPLSLDTQLNDFNQTDSPDSIIAATGPPCKEKSQADNITQQKPQTCSGFITESEVSDSQANLKSTNTNCSGSQLKPIVSTQGLPPVESDTPLTDSIYTSAITCNRTDSRDIIEPSTGPSSTEKTQSDSITRQNPQPTHCSITESGVPDSQANSPSEPLGSLNCLVSKLKRRWTTDGQRPVIAPATKARRESFDTKLLDMPSFFDEVCDLSPPKSMPLSMSPKPKTTSFHMAIAGTPTLDPKSPNLYNGSINRSDDPLKLGHDSYKQCHRVGNPPEYETITPPPTPPSNMLSMPSSISDLSSSYQSHQHTSPLQRMAKKQPRDDPAGTHKVVKPHSRVVGNKNSDKLNISDPNEMRRMCIAKIAKAILSDPSQQLSLSDIQRQLAKDDILYRSAAFRSQTSDLLKMEKWFVRASKRIIAGRGFLYTISPDYKEDFMKEIFRDI